jgi:mycofactocin precursor
MVETGANGADAPVRPNADVRAERVTGEPEPPADPPAELVAAELLVEDVSIDGMCGVY